MRWLSFLTLSLLFVNPSCAQDSVLFDFDTTLPDSAVTHIFINLNFNFVEEIPEDIGRFNQLRELTFFHQSDFFHADNWKTPGHRYVDLEEANITGLPESITQCGALEILKISEGNIQALPDSFQLLKRLSILQLPVGTNLDLVIDKILSLDSLEIFECWLCPISDENIVRLTSRFPKAEMIISEDDLYRALNRPEKHIVNINDVAGIAFSRRIEAEMFVACMPTEDREKYNVSVLPVNYK